MAHHSTPSQRATAVARVIAGESREMVYYLRRGRFVKIGTTINLSRRMSMLRRHRDPDGNAGPLTLYLVEPGGREAEAVAHQRFRASAVAPPGEWFYADADVLGYVLRALQAWRIASAPGGLEWLRGEIQRLAREEMAAIEREHPEIDWSQHGLPA